MTLTAEQAVIEAQASLQTKDIIFEVDSATTGLGIKEPYCFSAQEPKGRREMVIDKVRGIDCKGRQIQLLALLLSTVLDPDWNKPEKRKLS